MLDYQQIINELIIITEEVGLYMSNEIKEVKNIQIEEKELNSLVSYVDKESEKKLVKRLETMIPESGFITEEKTIATSSKNIMWIIDPLDGTTNYLFGLPHYSTSIALSVASEVVLGIVRNNASGEVFWSIKGEGAYLHQSKLKQLSPIMLSNALMVTGFPYMNDYDPMPYFKIIEYWLKNTRGLRRFGSAALDLVYVAAGRFTCYYEEHLNIWDLAAGALIARESGAIVSDYTGTSQYLEKGQIIASNPHIYKEAITVIQTNLYGSAANPEQLNL